MSRNEGPDKAASRLHHHAICLNWKIQPAARITLIQSIIRPKKTEESKEGRQRKEGTCENQLLTYRQKVSSSTMEKKPHNILLTSFVQATSDLIRRSEMRLWK